MGLYDRGYMTESEESVNYSGRKYSAVAILIGINFLVWLLWQFARNENQQQFLTENFVASADGILNHYRIHTLLTYAISHIDFQHLFWNMIFFWFLGGDVERIYGYRNFFVLYAFCGIFSGLGYILVSGVLAHETYASVIGASGAIMGIMVCAAIFDPNKPVALFGLITLPLKYLAVLYILFDLWNASKPSGHMGPMVAYTAHLGGALAGYIFWKLDLRVFTSPGGRDTGLMSKVKRWLRRKPRLTLVEKKSGSDRTAASSGRYMPEREPVEVHSHASVDAATSRRVDELLGKISKQGMNSLTDEERQFLKQSSEKYKK